MVGTQGNNVEMSGIGVDFSYFHATICFSFSLINTVFFFIWGVKIQSHAHIIKSSVRAVVGTQGNVEMSGISGIAKPNFPLQDMNMEILGNIFWQNIFPGKLFLSKLSH